MRRVLVLLLCAASLSACSGDGAEDAATTRADTLTRRQRDSIIAGSRLPGAGAVGRALETSDAAADRATAHDTIH